MSEARELLAEVTGRGISLIVEGDELRYRAPQGALTQDLRSRLRANKLALIRTLGTSALEAYSAERAGPATTAGDEARRRLAHWALTHGCPALQFQPWLRVVGTPDGWFTFVRTSSDAEIEAALHAAESDRTG